MALFIQKDFCYLWSDGNWSTFWRRHVAEADLTLSLALCVLKPYCGVLVRTLALVSIEGKWAIFNLTQDAEIQTIGILCF